MTGLRVLHVAPGDLGKLSAWPEIIEYAATGGTESRLDSGAPVFNAIWLSPFFKRTQTYTFNKYPRRGSLYAIRDHMSVDPAFSTLPADSPDRHKTDEEHLRSFCHKATRKGVRILGDLVLNHVAADHDLAVREDSDIKAIRAWGKDIRLIAKNGDAVFERQADQVFPEHGDKIIGISYIPDGASMPGSQREDGRFVYPLLFCYDKNLGPLVDSSLGQNWSDVSKINYDNPEAKTLFTQMWKDQVKWLLDMGFTGFRCDAAYKIDPSVWSDVIQFSHDEYDRIHGSSSSKRFQHPVWVAETLGGTQEQVESSIGRATIQRKGKQYPAFDDGMLWTHWWDGIRREYADTTTYLNRITRFGGLGVPDNHDTESTLAARFAEAHSPDVVSNHCFNKAVMSLILGATGICMEYGYLHCLEEQTSIFDEPEIFEKRRRLMEERNEGHPLNISERFRAVINYFDCLEREGLVPQFDHVHFATPAGEKGGLLRYTLDISTAGKERSSIGKMTVFINNTPERGSDQLNKLDPRGAKDVRSAKRLVLGPHDAEFEEEDGSEGKSFLTVYDLAIFTDLHMEDHPAADLPHHRLPRHRSVEHHAPSHA